MNRDQRFQVSYVHYDGNAHGRAVFDTLREAQEHADALRQRISSWYQWVPKDVPPSKPILCCRAPLPVIVTDLDDPERGDISDVWDEEAEADQRLDLEREGD